MNTPIQTLAVAALGPQGLDAEVSGHFGRCPYYTVVSLSDGQISGASSVANPFFQAHEPGVIPAFIRDLGADAILAGGMGPRAIQLFQQYGIVVATGAIGRVGAVAQAFLDGRLQGTAPCAHDHPESCGGHN